MLESFQSIVKGDQLVFLVVDVQEKFIPHINQAEEMLGSLRLAIQGFQLFKSPVYVSEQVPEKLGKTTSSLKTVLNKEQIYWPKHTFSCLAEPSLKEKLFEEKRDVFVLAGIETHVCILQTAKALVAHGKRVIVLEDATSSRWQSDHLSAIEELRSCKIRVTSTEALLCEITQSSTSPEFPSLKKLLVQRLV